MVQATPPNALREGRKRVLLLNPPGNEIYIRDYYCSKVSKTTYVYTPVDLLIVSARLRDHVDLFVVDAIGERLAVDQSLDRIQSINPDIVVFLTAAVSWESDIDFLRKLRRFFKGKILASGDVLMDAPQQMLETVREIDAVLVDFTTPEVLDYCRGENRSFSNIIVRGKNLESGSDSESTEVRTYDIPIPCHELFPLNEYRYPFVRHLPFATVLTDFGCAFKCTFCIQSTLEFKTRSAENVLVELRYLKQKGFRDIYFSDQTFAFNGARAKQIFQTMIDEKFNFGWVAFYRVDLVRPEMLDLMKKAGCHTLMFGIENASEKLLHDYKKNIKLTTIREALKLCHEKGIRTVGTFILGFPHETEADIQATIQFSLDLPLDYVSYNLPVPRSKTEFRRQAIDHKIFQENQIQMDQSGKYITMGNQFVTPQRLFALRNEAIRRFYLRPSYLLRRLLGIRTWDEFKINLLDGLTLLREAFRQPK